MAPTYKGPKSIPLTEKEIEQKYIEIQEELQEVYNWKKEEEAKLADPKSSPQKKAAAKRSLKKVDRRIDTVKGQIIYWELRKKGESHFKAGIEMNEYWAKCREEKEVEQKKLEEESMPELLKKKR